MRLRLFLQISWLLCQGDTGHIFNLDSQQKPSLFQVTIHCFNCGYLTKNSLTLTVFCYRVGIASPQLGFEIVNGSGIFLENVTFFRANAVVFFDVVVYRCGWIFLSVCLLIYISFCTFIIVNESLRGVFFSFFLRHSLQNLCLGCFKFPTSDYREARLSTTTNNYFKKVID